MRKILLGIDIGTSSCKIVAFDESGAVLERVSKDYPIYYPAAGWAEQNPDFWWKAVCTGIHELLIIGKIKAEEICGIGVDGQSWSCIPIGSKGEVLSNTPIWMDTRAQDICKKINREIGGQQIFDMAGNGFLPSYTTPKILWFQEHRKDIFKNTEKFLQSNSFIVYRLTGIMSQELSQSYGLHFFDMKKLCYDETRAKELGLTSELVPELYGCDQIVGEVTKEAAAETGLAEGTPVVAGGLDAACAALGAGVYLAGQTQEQGGQAGGMSVCTSECRMHSNLILSPHVVPGLWLLQGGTVGGGGALKWFRQEFCPDMSFDQMTQEAERVTAGADGLVFLPYMAGERSPVWNPDAKGIFYGISFNKTRGHFVRAVLEGVAYSLEHNLQIAEKAGVYVDVMNATGGAANSLIWTQIKADVTGKRIQIPSPDTTAARGAAMLAGIGCGIYKNYDEAVSKNVYITRIQEPDMKNHKTYMQILELYFELYEKLEETFSKYR